MALIIFEVALVTHNILDVNKKFWIVKNPCSYSGPSWAQDVEESGGDIHFSFVKSGQIDY